MTVYRKLHDVDMMHTVMTPSREVSVTSGTSGWTGGDGSGKASVYARARGVGGSGVITPVSSSYPQTASVRFCDLRFGEGTETQFLIRDKSRRTIDSLYRHYSRYNQEYTSSSYDYQCIFFSGMSENIIVARDCQPATVGGMRLYKNVTQSLCVEAWVMPFTSSEHHDGNTIISRNGLYWFGVTGSDYRLAFSSSLAGVYVTDTSLQEGVWSHVAASVGNGTASLLVNAQMVKEFNYNQHMLMQTGSSMAMVNLLPVFTVGNTYADAVVGGETIDFTLVNIEDFTESDDVNGSTTRSFHGMIHEVREWNRRRSISDISASHNSRLTGRETGLQMYLPMTEGHKSGSALSGTNYIGSGTCNLATEFDNVKFFLKSFTAVPSWHPNNNTYFYPNKSVMKEHTSYSQNLFKFINIPKLYYGTSIVTGSVELICRSFNTANTELSRIIKDDCRGTLYVSSYMSSSVDDNMRAATWNRVGNIFYDEGIILITDDSMLTFGADSPGTSNNDDKLLTISFRGMSSIPTKIISCRLGGGDANGSINKTYYTVESGSTTRVVNSDDTYITSVVLYDAYRRPVAVAKLATPLRKQEGDRLNIRLRKDF